MKVFFMVADQGTCWNEVLCLTSEKPLVGAYSLLYWFDSFSLGNLEIQKEMSAVATSE